MTALRPVTATGPMSDQMPLRFSTMYADDVTGDVKYLFRDLSPEGRWTSRDPIGERGGKNVYNFLNNSITAQIDAFGERPHTATDELIVHNGGRSFPIRYPRTGPFQNCCASRLIGFVKPLAVVVDADQGATLQGEYPSVYAAITKSFKMHGGAAAFLNTARFIGGGPWLKFEQTKAGKACCPKFVWQQTIVGPGRKKEKGDGEFSSEHYADYAGVKFNLGEGRHESLYHLQLKCKLVDRTFTIWEMYWSYEAEWTPNSATVTVNVPW